MKHLPVLSKLQLIEISHYSRFSQISLNTNLTSHLNHFLLGWGGINVVFVCSHENFTAFRNVHFRSSENLFLKECFWLEMGKYQMEMGKVGCFPFSQLEEFYSDE